MTLKFITLLILIYAFSARSDQCTTNDWQDPTLFPKGFETIVERFSNAQTSAKNERFIEVSSQEGDFVFLHWDFKALKKLNDKVFITKDSYGKMGVDAAISVGQNILLSKIKTHHVLKDLLVAEYSDYKSSRLAFYGQKNSTAIEQALREVGESARFLYSKVLTAQLKKQNDLQKRIIKEKMSDLSEWHTFEIASRSSDMASTFARFSHARKLLGIPERGPITKEHVAKAVERMEAELRPGIVAELKGTRLMELGPSGEWIPSKILLEVVRKAPSGPSEFVSYLQAVSEARLRESISKESCEKIREYFQLIDLFSPSVLVSKPVNISLDAASKGALSIDFAGQNVFNLFYTADAIASRPKNLKGDALADYIVRKSRQNDIDYASPRLQSLRDNINAIAARYGLGKVKFTGDDGMIVLQKRMNQNIFDNFLKDLSKYSLTGAISDYRVVYMHPIVKKGRVDGEAMRLKISSEGEAAEKKFRSWSSNMFSLKSTESLGIGVELYPDAQRMEFVFVGTGSAKAKQRMQREMQAGFSKEFGYENGQSRSVNP